MLCVKTHHTSKRDTNTLCHTHTRNRTDRDTKTIEDTQTKSSGMYASNTHTQTSHTHTVTHTRNEPRKQCFKHHDFLDSQFPNVAASRKNQLTHTHTFSRTNIHCVTQTHAHTHTHTHVPSKIQRHQHNWRGTQTHTLSHTHTHAQLRHQQPLTYYVHLQQCIFAHWSSIYPIQTACKQHVHTQTLHFATKERQRINGVIFFSTEISCQQLIFNDARTWRAHETDEQDCVQWSWTYIRTICVEKQKIEHYKGNA